MTRKRIINLRWGALEQSFDGALIVTLSGAPEIKDVATPITKIQRDHRHIGQACPRPEIEALIKRLRRFNDEPRDGQFQSN